MAYRDLVLADSPLAYFELSETSGSVAEDSSGNNRDGTHANSPTIGVTSGVIGGGTCYTLDAAANEAVVGIPVVVDLSSAATLEAWVRRDISPATAGDWGYIIDRWSPANQDGELYIASYTNAGNTYTTFEFGFWDANEYMYASYGDADWHDGKWHHVVGTWDGSFMRLYVDGEVVDAVDYTGGPYAVDTPANPFAIGFDGLAYSHPGEVDEAAIYDRALSPAEITEHFFAGSWSRFEGFEDTTYTFNYTYGGTNLGGPAPTWYRDTSQAWNGSYSFRSGDIDDNGNTWFEATYSIPEQWAWSFRYRTQSEAGWDYLRVHIDGTQVAQFSGTSPSWFLWTSDPISAGSHTIRIEYVKDEVFSSGADAVWVDDLRAFIKTSVTRNDTHSADLVRVTATSSTHSADVRRNDPPTQFTQGDVQRISPLTSSHKATVILVGETPNWPTVSPRWTTKQEMLIDPQGGAQGGMAEADHMYYSNDNFSMHRYDVSEDYWENRPSNERLLLSRSDAGYVWDGQNRHYIAGSFSGGVSTVENQHNEKFDTSDGSRSYYGTYWPGATAQNLFMINTTWKQPEGITGNPVIDGKAYFLGGNWADDQEASDKTTRINLSTGSWETLANFPANLMPWEGGFYREGRSAGVCCAYEGKVYLFGGVTYMSPSSDATGSGVHHNYVYDPATNIWTEIAPLPLAVPGDPFFGTYRLAFHSSQINVVGERAYIAGGRWWAQDPLSQSTTTSVGDAWVGGGVTPTLSIRRYGINISYHFPTDTFRAEPPSPYRWDQYGAISGVKDGEIWFAGGEPFSGTAPPLAFTAVFKPYPDATPVSPTGYGWGISI